MVLRVCWGPIVVLVFSRVCDLVVSLMWVGHFHWSKTLVVRRYNDSSGVFVDIAANWSQEVRLLSLRV